MAKVKVEFKKKPNLKKQVAIINKLNKSDNRVSVGVPIDSLDYPDGTKVVSVALAHEFGTDNLPELAFIRGTVAAEKKTIKKFWSKEGKGILLGTSDPDTALNKLGLLIASKIKVTIREIHLIDTGHLRQSVTFVVGKGDELS